ncbi:MAG: M64 family metallo-endopeptidase [Gammaproteobacteria bacterium]|nr:M64 family metallo-endopeptidase [Gammaproteobacteria bacterium]MDH5693158.1 M64 family metallo-endopeptidase [Gammaproteobacteria bacterium]
MNKIIVKEISFKLPISFLIALLSLSACSFGDSGKIETRILPTANSYQLNTTMGMARVASLTGSTESGTITGYKIVQAPVNGTLGAIAFNQYWGSATVVYTPNAGFVGTDSFTFASVNSEGSVSEPATVSYQVYPLATSTLLQGRSDGKGVDLVIIGDAFTATDQPRFRDAVQKYIDHFSTYDPLFAKQVSAWNIHRLDLISPTSNLDELTPLEAHFYCIPNIRRALCVDSTTARIAVSAVVPQYDEIVVLVNTDTGGGTGGASVAVSNVSSSSDPLVIASWLDTILHEMGHSFAGLGDEYIDNTLGGLQASFSYEPPYPNLTINNDTATVKWNLWLDDPNVDVFEGGLYYSLGVWRPTFTSMMREFSQPFYAVNLEAWTLALYDSLMPFATSKTFFSFLPVGTLPQRYLGDSPDGDIFIDRVETNVSHALGGQFTYSVEQSIGATVQQVDWYVNDILTLSNSTSFTCCTAQSSNYKVTAKVYDISGAVRNDESNSSNLDNITRDNIVWNVTLQ